jgi:hypothetical protein
MREIHWQVPGWLACATSMLLLCGCGNDRPTTIPVSGTVKFQGGPPPAAGTLYFTLEKAERGFPLRPGVAEFDAAGRFTVKTWDRGDGLMPGRYRVAVECWKVPPVIDGPPAESYVPEECRNAATSNLEVVIQLGDGRKKIELDIKRSTEQ